MVPGTHIPRDTSPGGSHLSLTPPVSETVLRVIAAEKKCEPTDLPSFYEAIDPDALDTLYARGSPAVQFDYAGYHIEITPKRIIHIERND